MAASLDLLANDVRVPCETDKVYKDECAYCFDTPESEHGLFICMRTFIGLGRQFVEGYFKKTGNKVYLHIKRLRHEIVKEESAPESEKKPTRLAIGIDGGFNMFNTPDKKYEFEELYSIVVLPDWTEIPLSFPGLPDKLQQCAAAIIAADSAAKQAELAALSGTWDGEKRNISEHALSLVQLDNAVKVPPHGWKCEKCDLTDNLWLNLTDGVILCGRRFWDGTGGNNHANEHYAETRYPLAVKLGTITPSGADVFSYVDDDMVEDPYLAQHLQHFGIDIMKMEKTDKTMIEMELELNQRVWEWDALQEAGSQLQPVTGPGYTGIHNLGNSCYMNAVMQVVLAIPEFQAKYFEPAIEIFSDAQGDPNNDFNVQMAKFAHGLISGDYSKAVPTDSTQSAAVGPQGIRPVMFKTLIGLGHPEFSTKKQQDAHEFLLHLFSNIERSTRGSTNPVEGFRFQVEDKIECTRSHKVKYLYRDEYALALPIPLDMAVNKDELSVYEKKKAELEAQHKTIPSSEAVRPKIPFESCLEALLAPAIVDDFYSSAVLQRVTAKKFTRLTTFPNYLFIHMQKFTIGQDWVERKLDVSVDMPDFIDLSRLKGSGQQPDDQLLPEIDPPPPTAGINIDESLVSQLVDMGFPREGCVKAVYHTKNSGIEPAMNWVMEHMEDADFSTPLQLPASGQTERDQFVPNDDSVQMIMGMGFTRNQAIKALKSTDNNLERAADWIFSHAEDMDVDDTTPAAAPTQQAASAASARFTDGPAKYELVAFISHMGSSAKAGHYICHIRKEGRWVIFNDEKVCLSEHPPKDLSYLYLYRRL